MIVAKIFEPEDLLLLEPQHSQLRDLPEAQRLDYGWRFKDSGSAFTLWGETPEGTRPVFCGGALRQHRDYAQLWALFSRHKSRVPMALTRIVRRYVAQLGERRVEAQVAGSERGACGWARLIGLEEECRLQGAAPDGGDLVVFVRKGFLKPEPFAGLIPVRGLA